MFSSSSDLHVPLHPRVPQKLLNEASRLSNNIKDKGRNRKPQICFLENALSACKLYSEENPFKISMKCYFQIDLKFLDQIKSLKFDYIPTTRPR